MTPEINTAIRRMRQGEAVGLSVLNALGILEISGRDAASFLQSQTSNDVKALPDGEGHLNALLDRKAHIQAIFSLHRFADRYWLITEATMIPAILAHFERFVIMEEVHITDHTPELAAFICRGKGAADLLESFGLFQDSLSQDPLSALKNDSLRYTVVNSIPIRLIRLSLTGESGFVLWAPRQHQQTFLDGLDAAAKKSGIPTCALTEEMMEVLRVEAGILRYGLDFDHDTLLPETGLESLTVSYTKGCYLGQEIIARIKTYGNLQKWLTGLLFDPADIHAMPVPNSPLYHEDKPAGILKSWVYSPTLERPIGFAYLHREINTPGRSIPLSISPTSDSGRSYTVTLSDLPFCRT